MFAEGADTATSLLQSGLQLPAVQIWVIQAGYSQRSINAIMKNIDRRIQSDLKDTVLNRTQAGLADGNCRYECMYFIGCDL
jgi:hypothetical protein